MSLFIEIIQTAERNLKSNENNDSELNNWMILILRFAKKGKENDLCRFKSKNYFILKIRNRTRIENFECKI